MEHYDVIVVGSGPAGSTAAYALRAAGKQVLVIEKEHLPRYKTCGGGISGRFLEQFPFSFDPVTESKVKSVTYAWKNHTVTFPFGEKSMYMVMRDSFDSYILAQSGAQVLQGEAVASIEERVNDVRVVTKEGKEYFSDYIIGADGASSIVAKSVGLRRGKTLGAAIEVEIKVPEDTFRRFQDSPVFLFGDIHLGYLWIFPKHDHLSVGIGSLHPKHGQLQSILKQVMVRYGISLDGAVIKGHPLPIFLRWERLATRRVCLVGDAAGLIDPFNGEGIRFAMKSGLLAAEAILKGDLRHYQHEVFWKIGINHTFALLLALIFYYLTPACYYLGVRNPFATRIFMEMMADELSYFEVLVLLAGSIPAYLLLEVSTILVRLFGGKNLQRRLWNRVAAFVL